MTYAVTTTGHGGEADDLKAVYEDFVRALRTVGGGESNSFVSGSIRGSDNLGQPFSLQAAEVQDIEAADTDDVDDQPISDEDDSDGGS